MDSQGFMEAKDKVKEEVTERWNDDKVRKLNLFTWLPNIFQSLSKSLLKSIFQSSKHRIVGTVLQSIEKDLF